MNNRNSFAFFMALGAVTWAPQALAQGAASSEPVTTPAHQGGTSVTTAVTTTTTQSPSQTGSGSSSGANDTPDHERFNGHFGVTYFGITQAPIASGTPAGITRATVNAPVIGVRYWVRREFGIDAGIGFGFGSGSRETQAGNATTTVDAPSVFAMMFHAGVPIAVAQGRHYTFEVIPELNLGFASSTVKFPPGAGAQPDISLSGFRMDVGARIGSEIHFGFIGIPELALQASVGLGISRQTIKASQDGGVGAFAGGQGGSQSSGTTTFTSTVNGEPWAIFANNISAIYYF